MSSRRRSRMPTSPDSAVYCLTGNAKLRRPSPSEVRQKPSGLPRPCPSMPPRWHHGLSRQGSLLPRPCLHLLHTLLVLAACLLARLFDPALIVLDLSLPN